ncbi:MAG: uroporphyrinogen-III C-methyltransferase [Phycisphaerales bacterium]|nr:uroporphyrinogen-III C-methyltransferase [Phycisphaerales bacterium]
MTPPGTVHLVGAGPGDPELITVKGLNLVRSADVIIHDRLIDRALLTHARADAVIMDAGKSPGQSSPGQQDINQWIIDHARRGRTVVRLKGGDPLLFGRGYEEWLACRDAGIPCAIVPGVSSALAGPASVNIPVTHRGLARSVGIVCGQTRDGDPPPDFETLARLDTVVVLMGRSELADIARRLIAAGRGPSTPVACIERATTDRQRSVIAALDSIADAADRADLRAPVVTVIGPTVGLANPLV